MADRKFWEDIEDALDPPGSREPKDFEVSNFWHAIRSDDLKAVERLMARFPGIALTPIADEKEGKRGDLALHLAARHGNIRIMDFLLSHGAGIDDKNAVTGETPLSSAAMVNQRAAVEHLLGKGALLEAKDNQGRTSLFQAAAAGYDQPGEALLIKGADIEARANDRKTPLLAAMCMHSDSFAIMLLEWKARTSVADNDGNSPFSLIIGRKNSDPRLQHALTARNIEERQEAQEQQLREMAEEMTTAAHKPIDMSGKTMSPLKFRGSAPA